MKVAGIVLAALTLAVTGCEGPAAEPTRDPIAQAVLLSLSGGRATFDESDWSALLALAVKDGRVDYRAMQTHRAMLEEYLDRVAVAHLNTLAPAHLEALLINAYNALTVQSILDHPRVTSIRQISGVWTVALHAVGGYPVTLDTIEHGLLRPLFKDPRLHFTVNCASRSCAPLMAQAYDGERLESQLDARMRLFLSDPANVHPDGDSLAVSAYFRWYGTDFTADGWKGSASSIPAYIRNAATPPVQAFIDAHAGDPALTFLDYDWSLNASTPPDPGIQSPVRVADTTGTAASGPGRGGEGVVGAAGPTGAGREDTITRVRRWVLGLGAVAPAAYVGFYALSTIVFIPGSAMTLAAGAAFGWIVGFVVVSIGSTLGAALAFLLARYLLRRRVAGWIAGDARFAALDRAVGEQGWKIVALTRLSPVFPFNVLNYALGLTAIGFWPATLISWVAMIPGTFLYVFIGATTADAASVAAGGLSTADGAASRGLLALKAVGVVATLAVVAVVARQAHRAVGQALAQGAAKSTESERTQGQ